MEFRFRDIQEMICGAGGKGTMGELGQYMDDTKYRREAWAPNQAVALSGGRAPAIRIVVASVDNAGRR
jgi:hypothetical protein